MKCFCEDDRKGGRGKCGRCGQWENNVSYHESWECGLSPWINEKFECKGKRKYETKDEANREIYRLMKESFSNTTNLRSYKCKYCKGYHFTSSNK